MKSLSFVCQSVCLFVCPSGTKFSRDRIISFFWYFTCWHVDIWSWYLVTNKARFLKKKGGANLGLMDLNQVLRGIFLHLLEFESFVFLEIAYNDTLRQFLTSTKRTCWSKFGANVLNLGPKLIFIVIFSSLDH